MFCRSGCGLGSIRVPTALPCAATPSGSGAPSGRVFEFLRDEYKLFKDLRLAWSCTAWSADVSVLELAPGPAIVLVLCAASKWSSSPYQPAPSMLPDPCALFCWAVHSAKALLTRSLSRLEPELNLLQRHWCRCRTTVQSTSSWSLEAKTVFWPNSKGATYCSPKIWSTSAVPCAEASFCVRIERRPRRSTPPVYMSTSSPSLYTLSMHIRQKSATFSCVSDLNSGKASGLRVMILGARMTQSRFIFSSSS